MFLNDEFGKMDSIFLLISYLLFMLSYITQDLPIISLLKQIFYTKYSLLP